MHGVVGGVRTRFAILLALLAMLASSEGEAWASTLHPGTDYEIACLDLETGQQLWRSKPGILARPILSIFSDVDVLEVRNVPGEEHQSIYYLDLESGEALSSGPHASSGTIGELTHLSSLKDWKGRTFIYDEGNTRHLEVREGKSTRIVKRLESFPTSLNIVGQLAIFTFDPAREVYAYNLASRRLLWEFDGSRLFPNTPDDFRSRVAADIDQAYVSVDNNIVALDIRTGRPRWISKLPRNAGWTNMGSINGKLLVAGHGHLYAINKDNGKLLWSFKRGDVYWGWPLVYKGRVFISVRKPGPRKQGSLGKKQGKVPPDTIQILRTGNSYTISHVSRRSVPLDETIWSSLRLPPSATRKGHRLRLEISSVHDRREEERTLLDLTSVMTKRNSVAYVRHSFMYNTAALKIDHKNVATLEW